VGAALALFRATRQGLAEKTSRSVLITGGSRGFGLALAREFAKLRCRIALCARDPGELKRVQPTLAQAGHEVFTLSCDISDKEE
jgi:NAD(P)-dependent dehydrogenase (short-subunit alcohol dehydrogenase family)